MPTSDLDAVDVAFMPALRIDDPLARHWIRSAMLHLRREVCWRRHLARTQAGQDSALSAALDLARYADVRAEFFDRDQTAAYLTAEIRRRPPGDQPLTRGSFGWLAGECALDEASCFALGLVLLATLDHSAAPIIAECSPRRAASPTLALAQLLWPHPASLLALADAGHPLWRHGILQRSTADGGASTEWDGSLSIAPMAARLVAFSGSALPDLFEIVEVPETAMVPAPLTAAAARLNACVTRRSLRVVPLAGVLGADFDATAAAVARVNGQAVRRLHIDPSLRGDHGRLRSVLAAAWLRDVMLLVIDDIPRTHGPDSPAAYGYLNAARDLPVTILVPTDDSGALPGIAEQIKCPPIEIPRLTYHERVTVWHQELRDEPALPAAAIEHCARRFRFEPVTIRAAASWLRAAPVRNESTLIEACRAASPLDAGGLAERVTPRFTPDDLVLAPAVRRQFDEIVRAMRSLGDVHYRWGTGRVWNEAGLSIMLSGPPGCGKGTFAESLASALELPIYKIDLSQIANKYVGETEKNLKRLFDAADVADVILFFDEADAIFGKRIDVRDAHDRYANLEVSYLLTRMERFKGLAILATNRRKDIDDAFLRRLRIVVELPLPESAQRTQIWRAAVPPGVDGSALDFDFLGRQFNLAGGHIRSAMFNACLQSAEPQHDCERPQLTMAAVVAAVKRELDKLQRAPAPAQFGAFAEIARELDRG